MIELTDQAVEKIRANMARRPDALGLRLYIKDGKGCGGSEYGMEYVDEMPAEPHDKIEKSGAVLFVPFKDTIRLFGTIIDFGQDEIGNVKFLFRNPNEKGRCGCGESVSF